VVGSSDAFIEAITTSQGAHESPLLIAISTQAPTDGDLFSIWLDDARDSKDPKIVSHVYKADESAGVLDKKAWKAANPALGLFRSIDDLREQANQAARMPSAESAFRNLCLNQRVTFSELFVSRSVWQECGDAATEFNTNGLVWCGLDLSKRTDLTAFVMCQRQDGIWHTQSIFWTPSDGIRERSQRDRVPYDRWAGDGYIRTTPGKTVDYEFVAKEIVEVLEDYTVGGIAFDRWRIDDFKKELANIGIELPMVLHGQGYKDMSPSLDAIEGELLNARIRHGNHPVLTMCASNAIVINDPAGGRKLDKSKSTGRIDGMVALAMAIGMGYRGEEAQPSIYEKRGVLAFG
jgi:phage terminase large subunit-like protein